MAVIELEKKRTRSRETLTEEDSIFVASQWQLMWWKFHKHKPAIIGGAIILFFYFVAVCCEFLAPYDLTEYSRKYTFSVFSHVGLRTNYGRSVGRSIGD